MYKFKLIRIYVDKKYLLSFKLVVLILALPFLYKVYDLITTGMVIDGEHTFIKGEDSGFYSYLINYITFSALLLWLGFFGFKDKATKKEHKEYEKK